MKKQLLAIHICQITKPENKKKRNNLNGMIILKTKFR